MLRLDLNETNEQRMLKRIAELEDKLTKLQLELAYNNYRIVDEPEKVITKRIPAKFGIEKVAKR